VGGARVLNCSQAFALELSKSSQAALMKKLDIPHPRTLVFNEVDAVLAKMEERLAGSAETGARWKRSAHVSSPVRR
jgi:phosphoribosylamine-glycine ligase